MGERVKSLPYKPPCSGFILACLPGIQPKKGGIDFLMCSAEPHTSKNRPFTQFQDGYLERLTKPAASVGAEAPPQYMKALRAAGQSALADFHELSRGIYPPAETT
jgi:hypothetical protein